MSNHAGDAFERLMEELFKNGKPTQRFFTDSMDHRLVDELKGFQPLRLEFDQEIPTWKENKLSGLPAMGQYSHCHKHGSDVAVFHDFPTHIRGLHEYSYWCNVCLILVQGLYQSQGPPVYGREVFTWIEHGLTMAALLDTRFTPDEIYRRSWYELAKLWTTEGLVPVNMTGLRGEGL